MVKVMALNRERLVLFSTISFAAFFTFISTSLWAANQDAISDRLDGVALIGLSPPQDIAYNVPVMPPREALDKIKMALAFIRRKSPFNIVRIETLKNNGPVTIIYDPRYPNPKADVGTVRVAIFLPNIANEDTRPKGGKKFFALIGRHGIKWPLPELAAVIVHELVGHGTQHLENRTETTRNGDLECQASLYQERAHQDFGMDKFSREMIVFQKQLAEICGNFIRYHENHSPDHARVWEVLNPDIPALLAVFKRYLADLDKGSSE